MPTPPTIFIPPRALAPPLQTLNPALCNALHPLLPSASPDPRPPASLPPPTGCFPSHQPLPPRPLGPSPKPSPPAWPPRFLSLLEAPPRNPPPGPYPQSPSFLGIPFFSLPLPHPLGAFLRAPRPPPYPFFPRHRKRLPDPTPPHSIPHQKSQGVSPYVFSKSSGAKITNRKGCPPMSCFWY